MSPLRFGTVLSTGTMEQKKGSYNASEEVKVEDHNPMFFTPNQCRAFIASESGLPSAFFGDGDPFSRVGFELKFRGFQVSWSRLCRDLIVPWAEKAR